MHNSPHYYDRRSWDETNPGLCSMCGKPKEDPIHDYPRPIKTPTFKVVQAQVALDAAKMVVTRLGAMKKAKTMDEFDALRSSLKYDLNQLNLHTQTI